MGTAINSENLDAGLASIPYGINPRNLASTLRTLAGQIERGELLVSSATSVTKMSNDEFHEEVVLLKFYKKKV